MEWEPEFLSEHEYLVWYLFNVKGDFMKFFRSLDSLRSFELLVASVWSKKLINMKTLWFTNESRLTTTLF